MKSEFQPDLISNQPKSSKSKSKSKAKSRTTNTKTIKAPGSVNERVAQACDRCRAKKTKCDGKNPCYGCSSVGLECIVSDKLSRRAFPKGYTETLEERVRQLEAENKKLLGILDIRDEQIGMLNSGISGSDNQPDTDTKDELFDEVTKSNLSILESESSEDFHHHHDGCPCGCSNPHAVHERPVSIAGSLYEGIDAPISIASSINLSDDEENDDDRESLFSSDFDYPGGNNQRRYNREVSPAPGAFAAATAIAQMQKNKIFQQQQQKLENANSKQSMLTSLVAISIPRSTEETLFIPTLLARVCEAYGYDSKPAILTANSIASLKEISFERSPTDISLNIKQDLERTLINNDVPKLNEADALNFILNLLNLPNSRIDLDQFITVYFQDWGNSLPVIEKEGFLKNYMELVEILETGIYVNSREPACSFDSIEKFGALMILVLSLSLLSNKHSHISDNDDRYVQYLKYYDYLIHEFIKPNCIITKHCSIQSLQILTLALQYCLVVGDINTCYDLRGRVISMAQQLRLHRCPAAVLGLSSDVNDLKLQNMKQAERRILFWCVYCLDVYSSFNLGVPRLFKDFEIECAMPFAGKNDDDDDDNVNILIVNNTKLLIVGKVSKYALSMMTYCKVLGTVLDSIFSRYDNPETYSKALSRDRILDCWRRDLPTDLKFEIDVNGLSLKDQATQYNKQQLTLMFLYYHARILIYLPILSKYGNHHNVGLSKKESLLKGEGDVATIVSSISMVQQSSIQILEVLKYVNDTTNPYLLPIPINIPRQQARFALLVAKGSLDYLKGGPLFQNSKQLLLDTIKDLIEESNLNIPGRLSRSTAKILELSILSILGLNLSKNKFVKKKVAANHPITKVAVPRDPYGIDVRSRAPTSRLANEFTANDELQLLQQTNELSMSSSLNRITSTSSNDFEFGSNDYSGIDDPEGLEHILEFDPFKVNVNKLLMNDFAADGSLGLVPFLDMNDLENNDNDNEIRMNNNNNNNSNNNGDASEIPHPEIRGISLFGMNNNNQWQ
ncbi:fungal-specific transcription factor domain-containing protein [Scheffersomyces coipomensis]|uniref:fungal-specific transcription factor domain-containing protein n=1 Tax=Scheffersomyces coipomensis TaxID=1788519 RepID=UPI00315D9FE9